MKNEQKELQEERRGENKQEKAYLREVIITDVPTITAALRDRERYSASPPNRSHSRITDIIFGQALFADGGEHRRIQRVMQAMLFPLTKPGSPLLDFIETEVRRLLERIGEEDTFDLVSDFATPLTNSVLAQVIGIPIELVVMQGADTLADITSGYRCDGTPLFLMQERLSSLLQGREHNYKDEQEYVLTTMMLLAAGRVTARKTLADGTLLLLPQWAHLSGQIQGDPSLVERLVEQVLCLVTPTSYVARWAKEELELGHQQIKKGQKVLFHLKQANEAICPHVNPMDTQPVPHLAFGPAGDIHYCIGAALARAELHAAFRGLFTRFHKLSLAGTPMAHPNENIGGLTALPVQSKAQ